MTYKMVTTFKQSKYLVGTSLLFLIPASYAYISHMPYITTITTITSLVSANFWRHANYSIRRDCDLIVSKCAMAVMCYNSAMYVTTLNVAATSYPCLGLLTYTYYKSHQLYNVKKENWLTYHMATHILLTYEQIAIIGAIRQSDTCGINTESETGIIMILMCVYFISLARYFKYYSLSYKSLYNTS